MMDYEKIGKFILQLRKEKKLTQSELAEKLNVTNKAVSKWERGLGAPDVSLLENLSKILNVSVDELLLGEKNISLNNKQSNNILIENTESYKYKNNKSIKLFLFIFLMFTFFILSLIIFNASMIISRIYLYVVFLILSCLFISILFFIKIIGNYEIKKTIILITLIVYIISLLSYTLYTKISYNLNNIKINEFEPNIIPFKTIITSFSLVIKKVQPPSLLFDYVIIDLCLFAPLSLFIPYLFENNFNHKIFLFIIVIVIFIKEIIQLITGYGVFNIDDIILNILGVLIMFYLLKKFKFIIIKKEN